MGTSRIEQIIEEIYEFIETSRMQPLSSTRVIVQKDELYDLLDELRLRTPDEIKRYQKIIANRDAIMEDADERADVMLAQAREKANDLVEEHEITRHAYHRANEMVMAASQKADDIVRQAQEDAENIRANALSYSSDILGEVERVLGMVFETSQNSYDGFLGTLKNNFDVVTANKKELDTQLNPIEDAAQNDDLENYDYGDNAVYDDADNDNDFNPSEDAFLDHIDYD